MLWVGGGIILHGLEGTPLAALPHLVHAAGIAAGGGAAMAWTVGALLSAAFGFLMGLSIVGVVHIVARLRGGH
jgi:predicted DNA repair protein MutK